MEQNSNLAWWVLGTLVIGMAIGAATGYMVGRTEALEAMMTTNEQILQEQSTTADDAENIQADTSAEASTPVDNPLEDVKTNPFE